MSRRDRPTKMPAGLLPRSRGAVTAIESASRQEIADDNEGEGRRDPLLAAEARLAAIRGEMDWGGYGHDALVGGASGAAGGALGGLAGAGVGAVSGALGNVAVKGAGDMWYQWLLSQGRTGDLAAYQAGDVMERIDKMLEYCPFLTAEEKQLVSALGENYKKYIDAVVQKRQQASADNLFNPEPQGGGGAAAQVAASASPRRRIVREAITREAVTREAQSEVEPALGKVPLGERDDLAQWAGNTAKGFAGSQTAGAAADKATTALLGRWQAQMAQRGTQQAAQGLVGGAANAAGQLADDVAKNPSKLKNFAKGLGGMGMGMAAGAATEWALKEAEIAAAGGVEPVIKGFVTDIGRMIREINKFSREVPEAKQAGNVLWTLLSRYTNPQFIAQRKQQLEQAKQSQEAAANQPALAPALAASGRRVVREARVVRV